MKNLIKVINFFGRKLKLKILIIILLILFSSILEAFSLATIFPYVDFLINQKIGVSEKVAVFLKFIIDLEAINYLNFSIFIFLIFLFKNLIVTVSVYLQNRIVYSFQKLLGIELLKIYTKKPLIFFSKINSSSIVRNLTIDLTNYTNGINSFVNLITEFFFIFLIFTILVFINFKVTLILLSFFIFFSFVFYSLTKKKLKALGVQRSEYDEKRIKSINQTINGIYDIKLNFSINYFIERFAAQLGSYTKIVGFFNFLLNTPKIWIEMITLSTFILAIIFVSKLQDNNFLDFIPLIGLYAASAFKIMPSFSRILVHYQNINYATVVFQSFYDVFISNKNNKIKTKKLNLSLNYLALKNINFAYKDKNKIIKNFSYKFKIGNIYGLSGESGAGKSTLLKIIMGIYENYTGKININNKFDIKRNIIGWQGKISFVPQKPFYFDETIYENICFGTKVNSENTLKVKNLIKYLNLNNKIKNLKLGIETKMGEGGSLFSGGELQRIALARALFKEPELLILDESFNALDLKNKKKVFEYLNLIKKNKIIIIVTHEIDILKRCSKKLILKKN